MPMNFSWNSIILSLALLFFIKILLSQINKKKNNSNKRLPPSPPAFPIIGHLHLLKRPLHHALAHISEKYGPATFLRFGSHPVLVIASRTLAEQCFTTHDIALANRVQLPSVIKFTIIGTSNYGSRWCNMRQTAITEALSAERLLATTHVRDREVREMVRQLFHYWKVSTANKGSYYFEKLELKRKLFEMSLNMKMMVIAGKRFYGDKVDDSDEMKRFRNGVEQFLALSGASVLEDFLPILRLTDVFGQMRKKRRLVILLEEMSQKLLEMHRREGVQEETTMISNLIKLQKDDPMRYTDQIIQDIIIVSSIIAYVIKKLGYLQNVTLNQIQSLLLTGTHNPANTAEWAISHLLNNQVVYKKAIAEIDRHVGTDRLIQESDLACLPYLNCIVNEVLRLNPGNPLLVPHEAREEVLLGGYVIPRGTMLLVNAYQIHRDPRTWDDPTNFKPERFECKEEGNWMIPFGMGRRKCPGEELARREVGIILGCLIQCFDWEKIDNELIDLSEGSGLTLPKAVPVEALYRPRQVMLKVLCEF